jgi:uncharacterized membrane protein YqjE
MILKDRFCALGNSLIGALTSRLDLAAAELEDLLLRAGVMLVLLLASALLITIALSFLGLAVILAVSEPYRWIPALGFMAFFGVVGLICIMAFRRALRNAPPPFSSIRDVLQRDAAALRPLNQERPSTVAE